MLSIGLRNPPTDLEIRRDHYPLHRNDDPIILPNIFILKLSIFPIEFDLKIHHGYIGRVDNFDL